MPGWPYFLYLPSNDTQNLLNNQNLSWDASRHHRVPTWQACQAHRRPPALYCLPENGHIGLHYSLLPSIYGYGARLMPDAQWLPQCHDHDGYSRLSALYTPHLCEDHALHQGTVSECQNECIPCQIPQALSRNHINMGFQCSKVWVHAVPYAMWLLWSLLAVWSPGHLLLRHWSSGAGRFPGRYFPDWQW